MTRTNRTFGNPARWQSLALIALLLLALGLRLYRLDGQSLWADEGNSAALAGRSFAAIARDASLDIHPPLYYFALRVWTTLFGMSEASLRGLSVLFGLALVWVVFLLGRRIYGTAGGLWATLFVAISPLQVYYAQEARMYMLAALLAVVAAYATWRLMENELFISRARNRWYGPAALYVVATAAGLYTHYFFPIALLVLNLTYLIAWRERRGWLGGWHLLLRWCSLQLIVVALYLPWLGVGLGRLRAWPAGGRGMDIDAWSSAAWRTLCLGPSREAWTLAGIPFLAAFALSLWPWWKRRRHKDRLVWAGYWMPILGALLPPLVMLVFGLRSESRLKFLLIANPFLALSLARGIAGPIERARWHLKGGGWVGGAWAVLLSMLMLVPSARALDAYYDGHDMARDDYRGMVAYISAVARPQDAIILNAPGQWEVFSYYYDGPWPVFRLPTERPPERDRLEGQLEEIIHAHDRLYVLYWATDESDPERITESWLDRHAFKGVDIWNGNVRFVMYQTPTAASAEMGRLHLDARFGDALRLVEATRLRAPVAAGDMLPITFTWRAIARPDQRLKVFVQLLDGANHVVGQRDAEPGGGAANTTTWQPEQVVVDNHAVLVEPGTPPGQYRLIAGLYDIETSQRMTVQETGLDHVDLGEVTVSRPATPLPAAALAPAHRADHVVGPLCLVGYDRHELGKARRSAEPLAPGSVLHVTLYWQALGAPVENWEYRLWLGEVLLLDWAPVGGSYPTDRWQAGELVRDQIDRFLPQDIGTGDHPLRLEMRPGGATYNEAQRSIPLGSITVH